MTRKIPENHRSGYGTWKKQTRDDDGLRLVGEQKFVRLDTLCDWFAPGYCQSSNALLSKGQEKTTHGGDRSHTPWPADQRHRMMAVHRIVNRWVVILRCAEKWQPWGDEPPWVRLNARGLAEIGHPDWPEILWPDEECKDRLRDDGKNWLSHTHRINKTRLALARGEIEAVPAHHRWHSEREIEIALPEKVRGSKLPHKTDGSVELLGAHQWTFSHPNGQVETLHFPTGAMIGIEIELSRKAFAVYHEHIFPDLLRHYDAALYLAVGDAYGALLEARKTFLANAVERRRIRILQFHPA